MSAPERGVGVGVVRVVGVVMQGRHIDGGEGARVEQVGVLVVVITFFSRHV